MKCPSCEAGVLRPGRLEPRLGCYTCGKCIGALLSLPPYLDWVGGEQRSPDERPEAFTVSAADSKRALCCPKCSRIMLKYKVAADARHSLDYCFHCEEVWLDSGEWTYLKTLGLHVRIAVIATDAWQRKLSEDFGRELRLDRFRKAIGEDVFLEVERFREWLDHQPARDSIVHYLSLHE